ncbi:MAG: phosphate ABC transporter, permease protein PstA, partial [Nitrosomonas sp.]
MREMKHIHTMQFLRECTAQFLIYAAVSLISVVFIWILADLARGGIAHLSWEFLMEPPRDAGRAGGIASILVSTLLILLVAL